MTDLKTARMLTRYNKWADRVMFSAVAALPADEPAKERKTLFKTMIGTLNHNLVVGLIWQAHLEGRDHGFKARNVVVHSSLDELREAQDTLNDWFIAWSDAQTAQTLAEPVNFSFISGTKSVMSRGDMMLHVVTHTGYHRGWVANMFFEVPARPPQMDLSVYLGEGAPVPA
jgi:uncharacterized damage-inducible protein DinB